MLSARMVLCFYLVHLLHMKWAKEYSYFLVDKLEMHYCSCYTDVSKILHNIWYFFFRQIVCGINIDTFTAQTKCVALTENNN